MGLEISESYITTLLSVNNEEWEKEIPGIKEHFARFGNKLPEELNNELSALEERLSKK